MKKTASLFVLLLATFVHATFFVILGEPLQAADTKVSGMTLIYDPQSTDRIYVVDDPNGTAASRAMTIIDFFNMIDTSAELLAILGDETGTGAAVFGTAPTLTGVNIAGSIDYTAGNIIYVPLAGDIQAYVTAAAAGDTLVLSSGAYTITSTITIAKELNIVGQGSSGFVTAPVTPSHGTLITSSTAAVVAFQVNNDNVRIANLSINLTGAGSTGLAVANNLQGVVFNNIDVIVNSTGANQGFNIIGSDVILRDMTFYITSSDSSAAGCMFQNNASTTQNAVLDCFNVTGTSVGGATYAYAFVCNNVNDGNSLTMNLSNSVCKALTGTAADIAVACVSTTTSNATVNAYMCTFDGADYDALQTNSNVLNLGGSVLVNATVSGTVTYRATMASAAAVFSDTLNMGADDDIAHVYIHDGGTLVFYDDSDDTSVTFGPVTDSIPSLEITGALDIAGGVTSNGTITGATLIASGNFYTVQVTFTDEDASPDALGEFKYDHTVAGMVGGMMEWHDGNDVRYIVDILTLPSDDDYVVAYDAAADIFYMKQDADSGGATQWDDIGNPDNSGLTTITFDNAETSLLTGDNDAAASFFTIQNTDADHTVGQLYLLDLDYSADDGDAEADYLKCQDSGGIVLSIQQDGDLTSIGTIEGAILTEGGNAIYNDTEIETALGVGGSDTLFPADPDADRVLLWDDDPGVLVWSEAGTGDMTKAVYDSGDSGGVDVLTTVDSTYASDYVLLTGTAVGTAAPKTDGALTYDATSGSLAATYFTGEGSGLTNVDAVTGDSATAFFDAGTIEHEYGGMEADVSDYSGLVAIAGGSTAEIDALSELLGQLADVTAFITDDDMPAAAADPDVDAAGEIGRDTDGANETGDSSLRGHDGSNQFLYSRKLKTLNFTLISPDTIDAADCIPIWHNTSGMTFTIVEWKAWSDDDDVSLEIEELTSQTDYTARTQVDAVEINTDGTGVYYASDTTITHAAIEADHGLAIDFDTSDTPDYVQICIVGWFNSDVD